MKNTKNTKKTSEVSEIFLRFQALFESFINKPSDPTLAELVDLGKIYKEAWIEQAYINPKHLSSYKKLSENYKNLPDFEEIISEVPLVREQYLADEAEWDKLDPNNPEIRELEESEGYLNAPEFLKEIGLASKDDNLKTSVKNLYADRVAFDETTAKKDKKTDTLKLVLAKEVTKQESPDKKTKIVTQSIFSNDGVIGDPSSPLLSIDFYQHAIRAVREHKDRFFNRRWYVEKSKDGTTQAPWWTQREQHDEMIKLANTKGFFQSTLDDPRLSQQETKIIFSGDLTDQEYSKYLREISFPSERNKISSNSYYFVIFESQHDKTIEQMIDNLMANQGKQISHKWRDVCIFSPNEITYRVITDDKLAKPTIPIEDSPEWSISNDMSHLSNQAMKAFIHFTHPGLKINNLDD